MSRMGRYGRKTILLIRAREIDSRSHSSLPDLTRQSIVSNRLTLLMDARVKPAHDDSVQKDRQALHVLAAVDVDLGPVHVGRGLGTQHVDDLGDFFRRAQ